MNERLQTLFGLFPAIDKELKKKGVTRQLLWEEYKRNHQRNKNLHVSIIVKKFNFSR